jgi:hypothetical protein
MKTPVTSLLAAATILSACKSPEAPIQVVRHDSLPSAPAPEPPVLARLSVDTTRLGRIFPDDHRYVLIQGFDERGESMSIDGLSVRVSDSTAAEYSTFTITEPKGSGTLKSAILDVRFHKAGPLVVTVLQDTISVSATVNVTPLPEPTTTIAVDSFSVVETALPCSLPECPYYIYVPVFRLRETTGTSTVFVDAVVVRLASLTIGQCWGDHLIRPGETMMLAGYNDAYYDNDLFGAVPATHRVPIGSDTASARLLVRDPSGTLTRIEARGRILRVESNPLLPPAPGLAWDC